ncbi:MAG: rubrerythrin family protein [Christensenellaceae bacterium]|nr:rubrerythrin family protein [Christensenellaceae bacterium]
MDLKNSKTWDNLHAAWAGETQAHAKYQYYAEKAEKDGYKNISNVFTLTSKNELAHSKIWFEYMMDGIPSTLPALKNASDGEHYEWSEMYARFAEEAEEEGFHEIATKFRNVAKIENSHMQRYDLHISELEKNEVFQKPEKIEWICMNCGFSYDGTDAPNICPVCGKPQSWFSNANEPAK